MSNLLYTWSIFPRYAFQNSKKIKILNYRYVAWRHIISHYSILAGSIDIITITRLVLFGYICVTNKSDKLKCSMPPARQRSKRQDAKLKSTDSIFNTIEMLLITFILLAEYCLDTLISIVENFKKTVKSCDCVHRKRQ